MLQHSKCPLSYPIVSHIVVGSETINIRCSGDQAEAKRRLWQAAQSLPLNAVSTQGARITVAAESAEVAHG